MWIKKSPQELKVDSRWRHLQNCLAALVLLLTVFVAGIIRWGFKLPATLRIAAAATGGVVLLVWWQRIHWRRVRSTVTVCEKCNVVQTVESPCNCACPCGGKFIPLTQMKWVESSEPQAGHSGGDKDAISVTSTA